MKRIILCRGLPGSGKSTWAKQKVKDSNGAYKRINRDDLRTMLDPDGQGGYVYSKSNEQFVTISQDALILKALEAGKHVILDDTNFGMKVYNRVKELTKDLNVKIEINDQFLETPLEECIRRDNKRANGVGKDVIMKFYKQHLEKQNEVPKVEHINGLPDALIVDLDGTTSLMKTRGPFEWKKCIEDSPNVPVIDLIKNYNTLGYKICFFSGRSDIARKETELWLTKHGIGKGFYEMLHMRKDGVNVKDTIVKEAMYNKYIDGKYNVHFVLDDRNMMVEHWRKVGLTCFQVAPGDF